MTSKFNNVYVKDIGHLNVILDAVGHDLLRLCNADLVLGRAGHDNIDLLAPRLLAGKERYAKLISIILDAVAAGIAHLKHEVDLLLGGDAILVIDVTIGTGQRHDLTAQLVDLLNRTPSNVTKARDGKGLALDLLAKGLEHFYGIIHGTIAGCLRTDERTAVGSSLARQDAGKLVAQSLVLAIQIANLTRAYADVTGRYVGVRANVALQLGHKALAEAHDLGIRLALGVKVRAALTAAHRKAGQRVLQTYAGAAKVYAGSEKTKIIPSSGKSFIFPSRKYKIA